MVSAYTQLLGERYRGRLDDKADLYIGYAVEGAARMQALIQDLLAFSRVGRRAQERKIVDCSGVLDEVKTNLHAAVAECGAVLDVGKLPPVFADRSQMVQLFQNLIGNALKFHKPNLPPVVKVRSEMGDSALEEDGSAVPVCRLIVEDNGIGFDEKYRDRIFQVFQRLHGRGEFEGSGIGLAICRKIAERHGGSIAANSTPGQGAKFTITLPCPPLTGENHDE